MMKILELTCLIVAFFATNVDGQLTDKEFKSKGTISFISEMIQNEEVIFGSVSKEKEKWNITLDNKVSGYKKIQSIFKLKTISLKIGLSKTIKYIINTDYNCYYYLIEKDDESWRFEIKNCNY